MTFASCCNSMVSASANGTGGGRRRSCRRAKAGSPTGRRRVSLWPSSEWLTPCWSRRRRRSECAHRRSFKVHAHCQHAGTTVTTMTEDKTMVDALASYGGTVTVCPPGKPRAPEAKDYGQAQFRCRCGHAGTMPYPTLFKRLRRRQPLQLRCQHCGRVLQ
jgi:hypothetical protein